MQLNASVLGRMGNLVDPSFREVLQRFCAKVKELEGMRFYRESIASGVGYTMNWTRGGPLTHQRNGPEEESIMAFLLSLRFFIQDNESISVRNVSRLINGAKVRPDLKAQFMDQRNGLNAYLDSSGSVNVVTNGVSLTRRTILETFIYGLYAHQSEKHANRLRGWRNSGVDVLLRAEFDSIVLDFLLYLHNLRIAGRAILDSA